MLKHGAQFTVVEAGVVLVAAVTLVSRCTEADVEGAAAAGALEAGGHWVVEVTARATHDTVSSRDTPRE
jgi:hypothetical protein